MRLHEFNDTIVKKEALGAIPAGCFINNFINKKIGQKVSIADFLSTRYIFELLLEFIEKEGTCAFTKLRQEVYRKW